MSMNPVKPAGYFARAEDERALNQFLRSGAGLLPQPPEAITEWSLETGEDGALTIEIEAMPYPGDAAYWGDGRAVFLDTQWSYDGGPPLSLLSILPAEHLVTLPEELWGLVLPVQVRAVTATGPGPWSAAKFTAGFSVNDAFPYTLPFVLGA